MPPTIAPIACASSPVINGGDTETRSLTINNDDESVKLVEEDEEIDEDDEELPSVVAIESIGADAVVVDNSSNGDDVCDADAVVLVLIDVIAVVMREVEVPLLRVEEG